MNGRQTALSLRAIGGVVLKKTLLPQYGQRMNSMLSNCFPHFMHLYIFVHSFFAVRIPAMPRLRQPRLPGWMPVASLMKAAALKRRVQPQRAPAISAGQPSFRLPSIESTRTGYRMPEALPKSQRGLRPYLATWIAAASPRRFQRSTYRAIAILKAFRWIRPYICQNQSSRSRNQSRY